jgi:hypothetical protein
MDCANNPKLNRETILRMTCTSTEAFCKVDPILWTTKQSKEMKLLCQRQAGEDCRCTSAFERQVQRVQAESPIQSVGELPGSLLGDSIS